MEPGRCLHFYCSLDLFLSASQGCKTVALQLFLDYSSHNPQPQWPIARDDGSCRPTSAEGPQFDIPALKSLGVLASNQRLMGCFSLIPPHPHPLLPNCSRGLNPPHRVKSISMTTFTESEVQFLQSRGNEACRKIWLGSFDSRTSLLPDAQDPQKVKEFLQEKYEKKRWYISPEQAKGLASLASQSSAAEVKTLLGDSGPLSAAAKPIQSSEKSQPPAPQPAKKASMDLLADIGGDPFAAPQPGPAFAAFPAFGGGTHVGSFHASPASQPGVGIPDMGGAFRVGGVPSSVFGALSQSPVLPPPSPAAAFGACTNPFATPAVAKAPLPSTNPFQTNGLAPGTFVVGSPGSFSASPLAGVFASPPLQQPLFPPQAMLGQQQNGGSPFSGFHSSKAGQRPLGQPAGISTNPFVTPLAAVPALPFALAKHPPTNPFL
ncbi:arf-GAP domain and FG repeat-containing protein 2 isoform X3 [Hemicordylus capensis]|uniref:arf-GAP domain and FG repeat-containing protein 2 isoform X3 n=1 Tax=Hemicordylus capensis TaxID=884348 RepID=UPI0023037622|nr:arf-GAP domain and FG repeat-containing protein 2 isoform X3 [Hemicordylus capensis]